MCASVLYIFPRTVPEFEGFFLVHWIASCNDDSDSKQETSSSHFTHNALCGRHDALKGPHALPRNALLYLSSPRLCVTII